MKKIFLLSFILAVFLAPLAHAADKPASESPDPKEMLEKMDKVLRGEAHEMTVDLNIKTRSWKRNYELQVWMKGVDFSFARVLAPSKVKGQGFLRKKARLWQYLPTAERTILIPPSMMLDRFMGSDFSNDDFVKMSYLPRDYNAKVLGKETLNDIESYHLELIPKPDAPVSYGKLDIFLRVQDFAPVQWKFFNERLEHIRTLHYSEFKDFGGHVIPAVWKMENHRDKDRETTITIKDAKFDQDIPDKIFSNENLENV
jgi:outer membrane lipoprotein-sorting protein